VSLATGDAGNSCLAVVRISLTPWSGYIASRRRHSTLKNHGINGFI
jgi:hypothetical protein